MKTYEGVDVYPRLLIWGNNIKMDLKGVEGEIL
jgi:hypothetical protein